MKLEAQWAEPVSLIFLSVLRKLSTEHSIGAFYQISVHFGDLSLNNNQHTSLLNDIKQICH
jgi:hypothetical protein